MKGSRYDPSKTNFLVSDNIQLNPSLDEFDQMVKSSDHLLFLYVLDSGTERHQQMTDQIIRPLLNELDGYAEFLAFDCQLDYVKDNDKFK